jgi:hypothetical protein
MHIKKYFKNILQTPFSDQYRNMCRERGTFVSLVPYSNLNMDGYGSLKKAVLFDQDWIQVQLC